MESSNIEIKFVNEWAEEEIVNLYKAAGWWKNYYDQSGIKPMIKGSFAFAVVIDKETNRTIGMGRIISDGVSDAYIQDLTILPEYRNLGIGKQLAEALFKKCLSKGLLWIGLIAEPGQDGFYLPLGFKKMKNYTPMNYEREE